MGKPMSDDRKAAEIIGTIEDAEYRWPNIRLPDGTTMDLDSFRPKERIDHAFLLVEAMRKRGYKIITESILEVESCSKKAYKSICISPSGKQIEVFADTQAAAITLAAVEAVESSTPEK